MKKGNERSIEFDLMQAEYLIRKMRTAVRISEHSQDLGDPDSDEISIKERDGYNIERKSSTFNKSVNGARISDPDFFSNWLKAREKRAEFFEPGIFADPAWDILLYLFSANADHRVPIIKEVVSAANVPATTAYRWITILIEKGLAEKRSDPIDRRRGFIVITPKGIDNMKAYLQRWA
ncbi:winged helix DNA-binding protein [Erythrobacter sp. YT30]|uniref:winged helix DNA-binding protein n=1 Tax=Erythrobacter sp. YT30 TaxID=1735012 RepID=UPI00076CC24E|nr:winged helix DNA-binding protein [Erythrobacter sp. YT30]KWV93325.1 hypothetical protein AUC45_04235 [Erythrobacter sp. YT30]